MDEVSNRKVAIPYVSTSISGWNYTNGSIKEQAATRSKVMYMIAGPSCKQSTQNWVECGQAQTATNNVSSKKCDKF
tara:strand:+ start:191 stop:418 length:228 start_codon:yes stop_codon:yes gene_type:complete